MNKNINQILQGDCLDIMHNIPDNSIDMILCDLPYGTTKCAWDVIIPFDLLWKEYKRIRKENAAIVLTASQPFTTVLINSNLREFKYELIWEKTRPSKFFNTGMPNCIHENICVFYKKKPVFNPQKFKVSEMFMDKRNSFNKHNRKEDGQFSGITTNRKDDGYRNPQSVIFFNSVNTEEWGHPTQKPVSLFRYLIRTFTNKGNLILDNCSGSGTTAIACLLECRNFICIEKNIKYVQLSRKRIEEEQIKTRLEF